MTQKYLFVLVFLLGVSTGVAAPNSLTYQGRIIKSDGTPLEYHNVSFAFEITSPDGICTIYREQRDGVNLTGSKGVFDVPIGSGTKLFPASPTFKLSDSFINGQLQNCAGGATWTPPAESGRLLKVQFHDGVGWKIIDPPNIIRSVPYAHFSYSTQKIGEYSASDLLLKSQAPTAACANGEVLSFNGTSFTCVTDQGGSGVISAVNGSGPITVSGGGSVTVGINIGTAAGTVAAGDDSRIAGAFQSSTNLGGDLSGNLPSPTVTKIQGRSVSSTAPSDGQVLKYNGTGSQWQAVRFGVDDLLSETGLPQFTSASCSSNQTLTWSSLTDSFVCANISIGESNISGTIAGTKISGNISGQAAGFTGALTGDVSGTQSATSVDKIKGKAVNLSGLTDGQILKWNQTANEWQAANDSNTGGSVTSLSAVSPLSVSSPTTTPQISINAGTGASQVLRWNTTTWASSYLNFADLKSAAGLRQIPGNCTSAQTLVWESVGDTLVCTDISLAATQVANVFAEGGNSFNRETILGTNDNQPLHLKTNNISQVKITSTGYVGIGTPTPSVSLDMSGRTDALRLPAGTDAQRPGTAANGMLRYNSTSNKLEAYEDGSWKNAIGGVSSSALSLTASDGSAGTPSVSFSGDTDTGWFRPADNNLAASTSGTERVRINQLGYVGIGTANPATKLEVASADDAAYLRVKGISDGFTYASLNLDSDEATDKRWEISHGAGSYNNQLNFKFFANPGWSFPLTLTSTGNLGLGLTSPTSLLHLREKTDGWESSLRMDRSWDSDTDYFQMMYDYEGLKIRTADDGDDPADIIFKPLNSEALRIASNGHVGMGTSTPLYPLHIESTSTATSSATQIAQAVNVLAISPAADSTANYYGSYSVIRPTGSSNLTGAVQALRGIVDNQNTGTTSSAYASYFAVNNTTTGNITVSSGVRAHSLNSSSGTIASARGGSFGIQNNGTGTITNAFGLQVDTPTNASGTIGTYYGLHLGASSGLATKSYGVYAADGFNYFGGFVGVGLTTPERNLDVRGDIRSQRDENYAVIESRTASEVNYAPHFVLRRSRGTVAAPTYVNAGDDLGVLTFRNHLAGSGATISAQASETHSATGYGTSLRFFTIMNGTTGSAERMKIDYDGQVGIGTSSPSYPLHVYTTGVGAVAGFRNDTGTCTITPNTSSLSCSSDIRLKKDIDRLLGLEALNKVLQLQAHTYRWKNGDDSRHYGYLAQDIEPIVPELVVTGADGYKQVSYSGFVPLLSEAIKEIHREAQTQKRDLASIEDENKKLKAQISDLESELGLIKDYLCSKDSKAPVCRKKK